MGQGADKTEMAVGVAAAMERLMKYRADREQHCQEEQHRQKTGQSRFCEGARSEVVSFRSHVFQLQSSTGNSQAQAGTENVMTTSPAPEFWKKWPKPGVAVGPQQLTSTKPTVPRTSAR